MTTLENGFLPTFVESRNRRVGERPRRPCLMSRANSRQCWRFICRFINPTAVRLISHQSNADPLWFPLIVYGCISKASNEPHQVQDWWARDQSVERNENPTPGLRWTIGREERPFFPMTVSPYKTDTLPTTLTRILIMTTLNIRILNIFFKFETFDVTLYGSNLILEIGVWKRSIASL